MAVYSGSVDYSDWRNNDLKYRDFLNTEFSYELFLRPVVYDLQYEIAMARVLTDLYEEGSEKDLAFIETILTRYGYSENAYNTAFNRRVGMTTYKLYFGKSLGYLVARVLVENNCVNEFIEYCLKNYEPTIRNALTKYKNVASGKIPPQKALKILIQSEEENDDSIFLEFLYGNKYPDAMVAEFLLNAYVLGALGGYDTRDDSITLYGVFDVVGEIDTITRDYEIDCDNDEKWLEFESNIRERIAQQLGCKEPKLDAHFVDRVLESELIDWICWAQMSNSFWPYSWRVLERSLSATDLSIVHKQIRNAITFCLVNKIKEKSDGNLPKFLHLKKYSFDDEEIVKIIELAKIFVYIALSDNKVRDMLIKSSIQKHELNSSVIADELERIKCECRKLASQNKTLKKQNDDLNNKILNRASKEKKGIEKPLLDEIKILQEEIQKQKDEIEKLKRAREVQDELLREVTAEHTLSETDAIDYSKIEVTRFLLVGGRDKITKQVLAKTKYKRIIKDTFAGTVDLSEVEYVIFFFDAMNHGLYYKIINLVREQKKNVIYCHGNNIDKIFEQIYSQMK